METMLDLLLKVGLHITQKVSLTNQPLVSDTAFVSNENFI